MDAFRRFRATSLAALVAAGSAAPLAAQGDPAVSVSAPRAAEVQSAPLSPFSVVPDAVQSAGFRTSLAGTTGTLQTMPTGDSTPPAGGSTDKLNTTIPAGPTTLPQPTTIIDAPQHFAGPAPVAPAWRWHGYGAVIATDVPPSMPRSATIPTPAGSAVSAIAAGPDVSLGTLGQPAVPAFTPTGDVAPAALPPSPQPLSAGEPAWKPVGERVASANPMSTGLGTWTGTASRPADPIMTVSASVPVSRSPAVTLDAPRVAGTYIPRGVSGTPTPTAPVAPPVIQPVSYAAPVPRPTSIAPHIRSGVERVCAGRGRDIDVSVRGPSSLLVRLKVRQPADAEYLANAISRMPELAPYQVQFEMQVAR